MRDPDGKVWGGLPEDPPKPPWITWEKNAKPRRAINDIDGIGSRANARCEAINQRMEAAKKTLLKTARRKNHDRNAAKFESFVRHWCRDPAPPVKVMDAYIIGCYGVGALYLVAYEKELSTYAPQFVDDYELYRAVGRALQSIETQNLVRAPRLGKGKLVPQVSLSLYELAELLANPPEARTWIRDAERYEEHRKSVTTMKRAARKVQQAHHSGSPV